MQNIKKAIRTFPQLKWTLGSLSLTIGVDLLKYIMLKHHSVIVVCCDFKILSYQTYHCIFMLKPLVDIVLRMDDSLSKRQLIIRQGNLEYPLKKLDFENMWENS